MKDHRTLTVKNQIYTIFLSLDIIQIIFIAYILHNVVYQLMIHRPNWEVFKGILSDKAPSLKSERS